MDARTFKELENHDLSLYYNHSYVRAAVGDNPVQWIYVNGFSNEPKPKHISLCRTTSGQNETIPLSQVAFEFNWPGSGFRNYKNTVIHFARKPIRNPSKGLTGNNAAFRNLMTQFYHMKVIPSDLYAAHNFHLDVDALNLLFSPNGYVSLNRTLEKIEKKQVFAMAVDHKVCFSQGILSKLPSVWVGPRLVGELSVEKARIYPVHEAFEPELEESFKHTEISVA